MQSPDKHNAQETTKSPKLPTFQASTRDEFEAHNTGSTAKASNTGGDQGDSQQRPQLDRNAQRDLPPAPIRRVQHTVQSPQQHGALHDHHTYFCSHYQRGCSVRFQEPMQLHIMNQAQESRIWPYTQYAYMGGYNMGLTPQHLHLTMSVNQMMAETEGAISSDPPTLARPALKPAPIPPFPRGPSQKPKQAGHALWVGNLPPAASILDLKDHFSYNATQDIVSLFLITKSNCAFVNYRTEAACIAAMNRFHDSRFHGVRLVCRLKRGSTTDLSTSRTSRLSTSPAATAPNRSLENNVPTLSDPLIVGQVSSQEAVEMTADGKTGASTATSGGLPTRFFILKSLTVQDLEASVYSGTWATQLHNEQIINHAFHEATNVYLIFSANKSGEYFGYARMMSEIAGERVHLRCFAESGEAKYYGMPKSASTLPTKTAPKGRIVDDIARGTIFWEAKHSEDEAASLAEDGNDANGHTWGRQFKIKWLSTSRLPFYRTRGLRNPWNANREVKIARDGTELEPGVARRLVQMFHHPLPSHDRMASVGLAIPRTPYL
ncbi:hypothetical protein D0866_10315 [Hortaea werneckii]|uniref:YTH domain-containing protein n=1 Tax=Hortaea werneckii TaxID=91943 RepID=A0A3M7AI96_HORWE|nr:hypothetical protein D0866_10315 [Hortaea werneckii]